MTDTAPTATRRAERTPWDERLRTVHLQYPSTAERDWSEPLRDYELTGSIIRDILKVESAPKRRGQRPSLEVAESEARLRQMWGDDYSIKPFAEALTALGRGVSQERLATKTGITRRVLARILSGETEPTGPEMERIAAAFGKAPTYFREYRTGMVLGFLAEFFAEVPEASVALAQRLSRRR